jgi:hypothetical protein
MKLEPRSLLCFIIFLAWLVGCNTDSTTTDPDTAGAGNTIDVYQDAGPNQEFVTTGAAVITVNGASVENVDFGIAVKP